MSRPHNPVPTYRKHTSGQARCAVRLRDGRRKDILLGPYGSATSKKEYHRVCTLVEANDGYYPSNVSDHTVSEVILKYVHHATGYYGDPSSGLNNVKRSLKTVRQMFGPTSAPEFGPKALKLVQERWVAEGITRKSINKMTGTVKRAFRWLVSEELLTAEVFQRLQSVEGLRLGRTEAPDNPPVRPADAADLEKAIPYLPPIIAAVCRLQALSGARCGELLRMKHADVERGGTVWTYTPPMHKGSWRGKGRKIYFGPEAQAALAPWLLRAGDDYVFSPSRSEAERIAERTANRITPLYPSHMLRNEMKRVGKNRKRPPGNRYATSTVRRALERACHVAGIPRFTPHRLRHLAALRIRGEFGIDHARAVLGHTIAAMTEHYSRDHDAKLATEVVARIG